MWNWTGKGGVGKISEGEEREFGDEIGRAAMNESLKVQVFVHPPRKEYTAKLDKEGAAEVEDV